MLLFQDQEHLVDDLKELEDKLYILSDEHENLSEITEAWGIIYTLLQKEKRKLNKMRENTQS